MITDEERREIAEELRTRRDCNGFDECDECQELSLRLFDDTLALCGPEEAGAHRWEALADLIDRPTCRLELTAVETHGNTKVKIYECSRCGRTCEEIYGKYEHCPHCGAVVIDGTAHYVRKAGRLPDVWCDPVTPEVEATQACVHRRGSRDR